MEGFLNGLFFPVIPKDDLQPSGQEGHLPEPLLQYIVFKHSGIENGIIRQEGNFGSCLLRITFPDHCQLLHHFSTFVPLLINFSLAADLNLQPVGQGVYNRSSHSVETSGYFISAASEFSTGVENGKYHFHRRKSGLVVDPHRDSSAVVNNGHRIILIDGHQDGITESCQSLVHRVIHNLIHQMVKTSGRSAPDIHSRTLSYRFQTLQDLDLVCAIFMLYFFCTHLESS